MNCQSQVKFQHNSLKWKQADIMLMSSIRYLLNYSSLHRTIFFPSSFALFPALVLWAPAILINFISICGLVSKRPNVKRLTLSISYMPKTLGQQFKSHLESTWRKIIVTSLKQQHTESAHSSTKLYIEYFATLSHFYTC